MAQICTRPQTESVIFCLISTKSPFVYKCTLNPAKIFGKFPVTVSCVISKNPLHQNFFTTKQKTNYIFFVSDTHTGDIYTRNKVHERLLLNCGSIEKPHAAQIVLSIERGEREGLVERGFWKQEDEGGIKKKKRKKNRSEVRTNQTRWASTSNMADARGTMPRGCSLSSLTLGQAKMGGRIGIYPHFQSLSLSSPPPIGVIF